MITALEGKAGSVFAWDGRVWHGSGVNVNGGRRRTIDTNFCLPWLRQQENWGVSTMSEVLEEASPLVQERLGMLVYGTLGHFNGALSQEAFQSGHEEVPKNTGLGNTVTSLPGAIVGEDAKIHPLQRVSRGNAT